MDEPQPLPRPCSTPHSAPVEWLRSEPPADPTPDDAPVLSEDGVEDDRSHGEGQRPALPLDEVAAHLRANPDALAEFVARLAPEGRADGWTPFARKLFLQVLADTGRVGVALAYVGLSKQSANALRHRDPLFDAGWNAAALIARNTMADEFAEKSLDGIVETVTRNGEVVAERRRFDTRLSIAVLHRLDKRCDRAEEQGSGDLAIMRRWDEYLDLIGKGDAAAARAILESPPHGQFGQLPESANPIETRDPPVQDLSENCWQVGSDADPHTRRDHGLPDGTWMTTFAPPPGFSGYENCKWDGWNWYERACTAEEAALIEAYNAAAEAEEQAELAADATAERDSFFARLRAELDSFGPHFVIPAKAGTQLNERYGP